MAVRVKRHLGRRIRRNIRVARELRKQFDERLATALITALGVVTALFWQTALSDTLKSVMPLGSGWPYEIVAAFAVTAISVVLIYFLSRKPKGAK